MRKITLFACICIFIATCNTHAQQTTDSEKHLVFFKSSREGEKNILNWATKKLDKYTFTLELSADSIKFYEMNIPYIEEEKSKLYEFVDAIRYPVKTYYRLRVFDKKGKLVEEICISTITAPERIVKRARFGVLFDLNQKVRRSSIIRLI